MTATLYSQSGAFTCDLHSSSVRLEVMFLYRRTCWLRKIEGLAVVTQLVSGPAHFPCLRWVEKRGPVARRATVEDAGSSLHHEEGVRTVQRAVAATDGF